MALGAWASALQAAPLNVLTDGFGDGDRDNDGTPDGPVENAIDTGAAFYTARSSTSIAAVVASDAAVAGDPIEIGTGNALDVSTTTTSNRPLVANFSAVNLADGDKIALSFDARVTENPIDVGDRQFRFGLYNSSGTVVSDNSSLAAVTDDDLGYFAQVDTGTTETGTATIDVRGDNVPDTGNSFLGGTGTNSVSLNTLNSAYALNDNDVHRFVLTLTRSGNELLISLTFDGTEVDSNGGFTGGTNPSALTFTYNEIALGTNGVSVNYRIDNVSVDYTPIPEPTGIALTGFAGAALLLRRRRGAPGVHE